MAARYLVCLVLVGLFGCSQNNVITKVTEAQNNPVSDNSIPTVKPTVTPTVTPIPESPVKPIGHLTNVKGNGEHQWGYSAKIWRQGDKIYGLISGDSDPRLIGDPPTGILENVVFEPKTGKLFFRAKLSLGMFGGVESRNVYEFDGFLTKEKLAGSLLIITEGCGDPCTKKKKITLLRSKELSSEMEEYDSYKSYQEWKEQADKILKFRGPKL